MTEYVYNGHTTQVNLSDFGTEILGSSISSATYQGAEWSQGCNTTQKPPCVPGRCQQPCNGLLVAFFSNELSVADKATLDTIVSHY